MRDLDDPDNPFTGQYGEWDKWFRQKGMLKSQWADSGWRDMEKDPAFLMQSVQVDDEGFVIPALVSEQRQIDYLRDLQAYLNKPSCVHQFSACGIPDASMTASLEAERVKLWASALPEIPDWLVGQTKVAIVLPDGRAVSTGQPSTGDVGLLVYRLHDESGKVVGEAAPGLSWQDLLSPGFTESVLIGAAKAGCRCLSINGYSIWLDSQTNEVKAAYDFDGNQVPPDTNFKARPGGMVTTLYGEMLAKVHAAQQ